MTTPLPDIVIGSGPAGVSVATALLARGRGVVMLDGGKDLPAKAEARRNALAATEPEQWQEDQRIAWRAPQIEAAGTEVRRFGTGYAMEPGDTTFVETDGLALRASLAVGGLSNFWGSAVLPYRQEDMEGWPITTADLAPHYAAVLKFVPMAGVEDALAPVFPAVPMAGRNPIAPGPQARAVLARHRPSARFRMGLSRQAVAPGCKGCGMCLHGCPWRLIWSASQQVTRLRAGDDFQHLPGAPVVAVRENDAEAVALRADGTSVRGARIYLAAGVLGTAAILLGSIPGLDGLTMRDSAQGFLPTIQMTRSGAAPDQMPFHTLPQMFAELTDPAVSPHTIHAQLYGWNEYYERDLRANYGRRIRFSGPLWRALARRLVVAQIFLHSEHSAQARLRLAADGRLRAEVRPNPATTGQLKTAAAAMGRGLRQSGLLPLAFALRPGAVGSGFHAGSTLPMAITPSAGQSDAFGRPAGWQRLHVVDSSILPAIPATTITLAVMANAHRIGAYNPG